VAAHDQFCEYPAHKKDKKRKLLFTSTRAKGDPTFEYKFGGARIFMALNVLLTFMGIGIVVLAAILAGNTFRVAVGVVGFIIGGTGVLGVLATSERCELLLIFYMLGAFIMFVFCCWSAVFVASNHEWISGHIEVRAREKQIGGSGGSLEPPGPLLESPGPLLTHLHAVFMAYSDCLPTPLNPLAERACFSQARARDNWDTYVLQMPAAVWVSNPNCTAGFTERCWDLVEDNYNDVGFWVLVALEIVAGCLLALQLWSASATLDAHRDGQSAHKIKEFLDSSLVLLGAVLCCLALWAASFVSTTIGRVLVTVLGLAAALLLTYGFFGAMTTGWICGRDGGKLHRRKCLGRPCCCRTHTMAWAGVVMYLAVAFLLFALMATAFLAGNSIAVRRPVSAATRTSHSEAR
jgi:hypothetical protein